LTTGKCTQAVKCQDNLDLVGHWYV